MTCYGWLSVEGAFQEFLRLPRLMLPLNSQAYGAARDTNMTKDEAKWVAYKLYRQARDHFERQQPKEKRILEYLLTIRDPVERT
jgi:hypothetical protein